MVSKKMIEVADNERRKTYHGKGGPEETAQTVVNAAWHKFDIDNESTWPENGARCLVQCQGGDVFIETWYSDISPYSLWHKTIYYASPKDLEMTNG